MPQPLAIGAQLVLAAGLEPFGVGDERAQLVEPRLRRGRVARQLVVQRAAPTASSRQARRASRAVSPVARERVEHRQLVAGRASRRCSNWPLIASRPSTAAATSSRAALRPHA